MYLLLGEESIISLHNPLSYTSLTLILSYVINTLYIVFYAIHDIYLSFYAL